MDGIDLKHFVPGQVYDVGTSLGTLMLAEGWAAPADSAAPTALVGGGDPFTSRSREATSPPSRIAGSDARPNLIRETRPPADEITMAVDVEPRKRSNPKTERG